MKKNKIPGIFRKQYKIKAFNSKILKRIHIPKDREMIKNLFTENTNGKMEIIQKIPKDILLQLKPLSKAIKKNKGMVSRWKLSIVLFIVVSVLVFNLFFKDRLLTKGVERGLESIFLSDVKIKELNFSLLKGSISYNSLVIADADNKQRNLLETGPSVFQIDMKELTKKRVKIEEMSLTELKWNTTRIGQADTDETYLNSSKEKTSDTGNTSSGILDILSLDADELDYKSILEQQKNNLNSLEIINQANDEIDLLSEKWETTYIEKNQEIKNLKDEVLTLESFSIQNIGSVEEGQLKVQELTELKTRVAETKDNLLDLQKEFQEDTDTLIKLQNDIKAAVDEDYAFLDTLLNLSSGDIASLASGTAEKYIRKRWNSYYENGLKAFEVYKKFQNREESQAEEERSLQRNNGRNIPFSSTDNPVFLIEHILLSGGDDSSGYLSTEINSVSSEPDKLTEPLTFLVDWSTEKSSLLLDGVLDFRSESDLPFTMKIVSPENSFLLEEGISFLNINQLSSVADITGVSSTDKDFVVTSLDIVLTDLEIEQSDEDSVVSKTIKNILNELDQIDFKAKIVIGSNGLEDVDVWSGLDTILSNGIGDYLDEMAEEIQTELRDSFTSYIAPFIEENDILQTSLNNIGVDSLDQISTVEDLENIIDNKKNELEDSAKKITSDLAADAQRQLDEKEAQAQAEADKIQAEADKVKLEAEKAKAEAEKKAQDEAAKLLDQATDKIKLPGF